MNDQDKIAFKIMVHKKCVDIIEERINACYKAMESAQSAANNEEKSSAGDKYETSRAMSHLEKDMYAKQLAMNKKDLAALSSINCDKIYTSVVARSVIVCEEYSFFIAAGLGKMFIEDQPLFLLSPYAPLSQLLRLKKVGQSFLFSKKELVIKDIF